MEIKLLVVLFVSYEILWTTWEEQVIGLTENIVRASFRSDKYQSQAS